jgi:hypothetical protein
MPWPAEMMPWAVLFAGLAGAGVGVVATWMHNQLTVVGAPAAARPRTVGSGRWALAAALAVLAVFAVNVPPGPPAEGTADVAVGEVRDGRAVLTVRADPGLVEDAYWFEALAWQGGGSVRGELVPVGDGVWRTDEPMPVDGRWKTLVRLHTPLHGLAAAPVYLPADPAIPAEEHAATSGPRELVEEKLILRREEKHGVPGWLWGAGYGVVGGLFAALFATVAVGYSVASRPGFSGRGTPGRLPAPRVVRRLVGAQ